MVQMLNLDHLETRKSTFKKMCWFRPEKPKLEKGLFESKQNNTTLWVNKKQGVPEPYWLSLGHSSELSKLSYLIWKRDGWDICWSKNFEFCPTNRYFLNLFLIPSDLNQVAFIFCSVTQLFPIADRATIPHLKDHIQSFLMTPITLVFWVI